MIPKRIFYVWGYDEKKSRMAEICKENWRLMLPEYEIIEINEKSKEWFDFDYEYENNLWFKTVYDLKMWAYVADYMRTKTIYNHGGIYFDTDVTVYKSLDSLLDKNLFVGATKSNMPELSIFGAQKGNPILKEMLDFYQEKIWHSPSYIICQIFKDILEQNYKVCLNKDKIIETEVATVYPPEYFQPMFYPEEFDAKMLTKNTYTVHWYSASWVTKKNLYFLSNKHRIPLKVLLKQLQFIEKKDIDANKKVTPPQQEKEAINAK